MAELARQTHPDTVNNLLGIASLELLNQEAMRSVVMSYDLAGSPGGRSFPALCEWLVDVGAASSTQAASNLRTLLQQAGFLRPDGWLTYQAQ
jgi:hypothetical protein